MAYETKCRQCGKVIIVDENNDDVYIKYQSFAYCDISCYRIQTQNPFDNLDILEQLRKDLS